MKGYGFARSLLLWIEILAWIAVAAGIFWTMYALGDSSGATLMFSIPTLASGLSTVALMRIGGAILDIAENTGKLSAYMRGEPLSAEVGEAIKGVVVKVYRGEPITQVKGGYVALGDQYVGVIAAEQAIDRALNKK